MHSSSLANWDGSQAKRDPTQSYGDVRTLSFGTPFGLLSTKTSDDHTGPYFDVSVTHMRDQQAVRKAEGRHNHNVSSMVRFRPNDIV